MNGISTCDFHVVLVIRKHTIQCCRFNLYHVSLQKINLSTAYNLKLFEHSLGLPNSWHNVVSFLVILLVYAGCGEMGCLFSCTLTWIFAVHGIPPDFVSWFHFTSVCKSHGKLLRAQVTFALKSIC